MNTLLKPPENLSEEWQYNGQNQVCLRNSTKETDFGYNQEGKEEY